MTDDTQEGREQLIASRLLKASPELVWETFTRPEHIAAFWGGRHATVPVDSVEVDLRVGGGFELMTVGANGYRHRLRFSYSEIDRPRLLVLTEPETGIVTSIELNPRSDGTLLTLHQRRVPLGLAGKDAKHGLTGILDRLEDLVDRLRAGTTERKDNEHMTEQKSMVETYIEGFRGGDHAAILECLTDDVTWYIAGHRTTEGKDAFDDEIENEEFEGHPILSTDRLIEEGDTVVAIGEGQGRHKEHGPFRFSFADVFVFRGGRIARVESYVTPLGTDVPPTAG